MNVSIVYGVQVAGDYCKLDMFTAGEQLEDLAKKYTPRELFKKVLRYGGGNTDGSMYIGIQIENLIDGYDSIFVDLASVLKHVSDARNDIDSFAVWWDESELANEIRECLNINKDIEFKTMIVMDSD